MAKIQKKLMIFHPTIAPYRIDFFNDLHKSFLTEIFLYYRNLRSQKFDYEEIEKKFEFRPHYMKRLIHYGDREIYKGSIKEILSFRPDIVIVGEYGFGTWGAIIARALSGKRMKIVSICDDSEKIASECGGLRKLSRNILIKCIDGLILCSYETEKWYKERFKINTFVFPIIQNEDGFRSELKKAIPLAKKRIQENNLVGKCVFVFVGRLVKEKNIGYLVTSFIKACNKHENIMLFIIGDENGDNHHRVKKSIEILINKNKLNEKIKLLGRLEGKELNAWFNIGQVLVLPSIYEPFGAVVNEALLAGQYVMVSKNAGSAGLVTKKNGEVLDIESGNIDFEDIIKRISPIRENIDLRESKMPYSYVELMSGLIEWVDKV